MWEAENIPTLNLVIERLYTLHEGLRAFFTSRVNCRYSLSIHDIKYCLFVCLFVCCLIILPPQTHLLSRFYFVVIQVWGDLCNDAPRKTGGPVP